VESFLGGLVCVAPPGKSLAGGKWVGWLLPGFSPNDRSTCFRPKHIAVVLIAMCLANTGDAASRLQPPGGAEKVTIQSRGRAYIFRGFIGLLTDRGMDKLTERINRTGVTADVNSYIMWRGLTDQAISDYRHDPEPVTIIGHSLGGDAAVKFAERLDAAGIPVSLLVTYDPTRFAHNVPPNVERYVNLYQSSNILGGGGDVVQGHGFHGHYASFDLKERRGMFHTNMEKFGDIHDQLVSKIAALSAISARGGDEAIPLRIDIPATASIELWDSGLAVSAHAGDTLPAIAATYHVPLWVLSQVNNLSEDAALTKGARIIVPRYLVPMAASSAVSSHAASNRRWSVARDGGPRLI
jgi:LysM domain-containing protein